MGFAFGITATASRVFAGSLEAPSGTLLVAATDRLQPAALADGPPPVTMSVATAVVVFVAWTVVPLALGAWKTQTRDA